MLVALLQDCSDYHQSVFFYICRWNLEPSETALPASQCPRAPGQEPGGKGCLHNRETEFPVVWYDHTSPDRQRGQTEADQASAGVSAKPLDQWSSPPGPSRAVSSVPCSHLGCVRKCLCPPLWWWLWSGHEASARAAGPWPWCREHEGRNKWADVGSVFSHDKVIVTSGSCRGWRCPLLANPCPDGLLYFRVILLSFSLCLSVSLSLSESLSLSLSLSLSPSFCLCHSLCLYRLSVSHYKVFFIFLFSPCLFQSFLFQFSFSSHCSFG